MVDLSTDQPETTSPSIQLLHLSRSSLTAICGAGILLTVLMTTGCAATPAPPGPPRIPPLQTPAPTTIPVGDGAVVGGIDFCAGVFPKVYPQFVAGTVKVYRGSLTTEPTSPSGSFRYVLPGVVVAQTKVGVNQEFRLILPPGEYVLAVPAPWSPVGVTVRPGATSVKDIPGLCL